MEEVCRMAMLESCCSTSMYYPKYVCGAKHFLSNSYVTWRQNLIRKAGDMLDSFPSYTEFQNRESISCYQPKVTNTFI